VARPICHQSPLSGKLVGWRTAPTGQPLSVASHKWPTSGSPVATGEPPVCHWVADLRRPTSGPLMDKSYSHWLSTVPKEWWPATGGPLVDYKWATALPLVSHYRGRSAGYPWNPFSPLIMRGSPLVGHLWIMSGHAVATGGRSAVYLSNPPFV